MSSDPFAAQETGMRQMRLVLDILRVHPYFAPQPQRFRRRPGDRARGDPGSRRPSLSNTDKHTLQAKEPKLCLRGQFLNHFWTILAYSDHKMNHKMKHRGSREDLAFGGLELRFWSSWRRAAEIRCRRNSSRRSAWTQRQSKTAWGLERKWRSKHRN